MTKPLQTYQTPGITVTYDPNLCAHAAECVRGLPEVFDPRERRWIRPERASPDEVERTVARCPTGALQVVRPGALDSSSAGAAARAVRAMIRLQANGPLLVSGPIRIETESGELVRETDRVALCRCGGTGNQPFCDGSHAHRKFRTTR